MTGGCTISTPPWAGPRRRRRYARLRWRLRSGFIAAKRAKAGSVVPAMRWTARRNFVRVAAVLPLVLLTLIGGRAAAQPEQAEMGLYLAGVHGIDFAAG